LEHFPILLVGRIFNGDGIVTFADFTVFITLSLLWNIYKLGREVGSETNFMMSSCSKQSR
jgi:hypothetical protein